MINARLLPRIISGASTGSIMASMICTLNEQDRIKVLNSPWSIPLVSVKNMSHKIEKLFSWLIVTKHNNFLESI